MNQIRLLLIIFCISNINYAKDDLESIIKVANSLYADLKFELASIEYKRATVLYPQNQFIFQIQNKMALCYKKLGYFNESINIHKNLLEKDPNYWNSIFETATIYQLMDNFTESNRYIKNYYSNVDVGKKDSLIFLMSCNYFALMQIDSSKFYFGYILLCYCNLRSFYVNYALLQTLVLL